MPKFEDIYGKPLNKMTKGEKEMVMFSYLERIDNHLEILNGKTECIPKIKKTVWAGTILIPALITWLCWLTKTFFGK